MKVKLYHPSISEDKIKSFQRRINEIRAELELARKGKEEELVGWTFVEKFDSSLVKEIISQATNLKKEIEVLVAIGIGGSYMGGRAINDFAFPKGKLAQIGNPEIIFLGHHLSSMAVAETLAYLQSKEFGICVISKSGNTLEPMVIFRLLRRLLVLQKGKEKAAKRIVAITSLEGGALLDESKKKGYHLLPVPENVAGRYSVLTPVGLFVMAMAGVRIDQILKGASDCFSSLSSIEDVIKNPAYTYAIIRFILHQSGFVNELIVSNEDNLRFFLGWWQQLFAESEGKNWKGLLPISSIFTTDLHSLGQLIQEGKRGKLFETIINFSETKKDLVLDQQILTGFAKETKEISLHKLNQLVLKAVIKAHSKGGIPVISLQMPKLDLYSLGYCFYFFMFACYFSSKLLGVDPFRQSGAEIYKKEVKSLLK